MSLPGLSLFLDLSHAGFSAVLNAEGTQVLAQSARAAGTRHDDVADWTESLLRAAGGTVSDLRWMAVGVGPGSFTGIRIAMAFAQGLALPHGIPLHGFTSFEALHLSFLENTLENTLQNSPEKHGQQSEGTRALAVIPANAGRFYVSSGIADPGDLVSGAILAARADAAVTVISPESTPALREVTAGFAGVWTPGENWNAVAIARHARASGRGLQRPLYLQLSAAEEKFGRADA